MGRAVSVRVAARLLRHEVPVDVEQSHMIAKSGRFVISGAVRRVSPQLAALTAEYLIVDR